ncbi:MAG: hypothetical protein ACFFCS_03805 [Candidatus Hodarchaeota archaeon]
MSQDSKTNINVFVANKGGCGKTLFSLTSILHGYFNGLKVAAIDLNFENPDTATILHGVIEGNNVVNAPVINEGTPLAYREEKINDRLYAIRPHPLYHKNYQVFNFLDAFLANNPDKFDLIVIDTGLNLTNLMPENLAGERWPKSRPTPRIFQIYTWSTGLRPWEMTAFDTTVENLKKFFNDKFDTDDLIHVLNPQAFIPRTSGASMKYVRTQQYMFDGTNEVKKHLEKLSKKEIFEKVDWSTFKKEILYEVRNEFWKIPLGDMWKDSIPTIWMTVMKNFLKKHGKVPTNILFHPYIYAQVALIIDDLIIRRGKNLETMRSIVKPVYDNYSKFMEFFSKGPSLLSEGTDEAAIAPA